jgi:UDP-N-acetylglucosamine 4,6-dehydratase
MFLNKKILIIGGTGFLGYKLTERYKDNNQVYLMSRDESKHWKMTIDFNNHPNINFVIGDIRDSNKIRQTLLRVKPNIIILAAAMKHIDKCEYESNECINTNILGTQNVLNEIEFNQSQLQDLETVCFVSTDKACSPVNIYGMAKAVSECLMVEKSKYINNIKFVCVRYGNVLNSTGSIIPILHKLGQNEEVKEFTLTDERMTRFVMTYEQSLDLIENAIFNGESGDIVIPKLISCNIIDMFEIFSEIYNKPVKIGKLRPGEKILESLINETQSMRLTIDDKGYMYIKPCYKNFLTNNDFVKDYNSTINPLSKEELRKYLINLNLIEYKPLFNLNYDPQLYNQTKPYPHLYIDNILPSDFALKCQQEILNIEDKKWDRYDNPFESKFTLRDKNSLPYNLNILFEYLTSSYFVNQLSEFMGEQLYLDPTKNWWGVHKYQNNDYLDIHVDAGIHPLTKQKKHCTLLIYFSNNWREENKGHLEIWSGENACSNSCELKECNNKILPAFNRLVLFTCDDYSWHGNPESVEVKDDERRLLITLSYVSDNNKNNKRMLNQRQKAFFVPRPNDPIDKEKDRLRFLRADPNACKNVYHMNDKNKM